jgi:hypothetical protein
MVGGSDPDRFDAGADAGFEEGVDADYGAEFDGAEFDGAEFDGGRIEWFAVSTSPARTARTARTVQPVRPRGRGPGPVGYVVPTAAIALLVIVAMVQQVRTERSDQGRGTSASPSASRSAPAASKTGVRGPLPPDSRLPTVTTVGRPVLGVTAGWELFARGPRVVARIQLAAGVITRTAVPPLDSSGAVSFVVGRDRAVVRPLDFVAGYVVADGQPARGLVTATMRAGPVLAGPDAQHVWVRSPDDTGMVLAGLDGRLTDTTLLVDPGTASSDGDGYVLFDDAGGVYDARADGIRRITTGKLLAVGPRSWLALECDDRHVCATYVIDRASGARRALGRKDDPNMTRGVISPDGATAALIRQESFDGPTLHLLDLVTGQDRRLEFGLDSAPDEQALLWSPDSRWLFAIGANGRLAAIDHSGRVHRLDLALPPLTQLALRNRSAAKQ